MVENNLDSIIVQGDNLINGICQPGVRPVYGRASDFVERVARIMLAVQRE